MDEQHRNFLHALSSHGKNRIHPTQPLHLLTVPSKTRRFHKKCGGSKKNAEGPKKMRRVPHPCRAFCDRVGILTLEVRTCFKLGGGGLAQSFFCTPEKPPRLRMPRSPRFSEGGNSGRRNRMILLLLLNSR